MSWQAYVDQSLLGTGHLDHAAIFNAEGNSVWAASPGFSVAADEMAAVVEAFKDKADAKAIFSKGFDVAGAHYVVIRSDDRSLYGKKGKEGIVIVKTSQALLVAHYPEHVQPGNATNTVESLADYLIGVGY